MIEDICALLNEKYPNRGFRCAYNMVQYKASWASFHWNLVEYVDGAFNIASDIPQQDWIEGYSTYNPCGISYEEVLKYLKLEDNIFKGGVL